MAWRGSWGGARARARGCSQQQLASEPGLPGLPGLPGCHAIKRAAALRLLLARPWRRRARQVHNALGFCYFSMEKTDAAIAEYRAAVGLQQGYVTAWNNLGDAYERSKDWR